MHRIVRWPFIAWAMTVAVSAASAQDAALRQALQEALDAVVASDETPFPGAILTVSHPERGTYTVASGVTDIVSNAPLAPDARFRAGSVMKPFVATVALQLVEEGRLSLGAPITTLLPAEITALVENAERITFRQLLDHSSGIPDWLTMPVIMDIAANPARIFEARDFVAIASEQPPTFPPGEGWSYSNTNYNLIGLVIDGVTGRSWREEVRARVIEPLGLAATTLPEPGDLAIPGAFMHGYELVEGKIVDLSFIDPSMAGAAGGGALVTTTADLAAFLAGLRAGELFASPETFDMMSDFVPAMSEGGRVGYGFGLEQYVMGDIGMIGHLGGTAGYRTGTFWLPALDLSLAFALSVQTDPTPVIAAALSVMAPEAMR